MTAAPEVYGDFVTVNAEAGGVRCVTYVNSTVASSILLDPNRAEAYADQIATEAARARSRKGALDEYSRWDRERQQLEQAG